MNGLIAFWSYALAACLFASILLWRLRERLEGPGRLLVVACFATLVWASTSAMRGPLELYTMPTETIRNLAWILLLYNMSGEMKGTARGGIRLVFGAVALVIGIQLALDLLMLWKPMPPALNTDVLKTGQLLRISTTAGALVLIHNLYGQAAPQSRTNIRTAMLGLALMWGYDLNLYTIAYLGAGSADQLFDWRGAFVAAISPLFVLASAGGKALRIRLSRAATFQSLALLSICVYFTVMAVLATALHRSQWDWAGTVTAMLLATMLTATAVLVLSQWARGWVKVKLAKHLFEHRYDYRAEWLRFTGMVGRAGPDDPPLAERIIKAFADIVDAPGGLLLVSESEGALATAASWNWPGETPAFAQVPENSDFWREVEASEGRILDFEALRHGLTGSKDRFASIPPWMLDDPIAWAGIPLIHNDRLIGMVILASPDYRRPLDWEDFDLLRTAGGQAASSLAEAQVQDALAKARRFEEFNRRFAFILHDIKNLVSQVSLLSRNAERHADNPEFRADMIATLKSSAGKMNDLLERLSPHAPARVQRIEAQPLRPILSAAIAAKRRDHDVRLLGDAGLDGLADASALEQAIGHLLQNAVDASPATEPVVVRVSRRGSNVAITVADKGSGMDGDFVRSRLFQAFDSTKTGGFGIGAFEARSLIQAMGGQINVESKPGKGTTFTVLLPARDAETRQHATQTERKRA